MSNIHWNDNTLFFTYEWWDETSMYDPHPSRRWVNPDYCERLFRCRVPLGLKNSPEDIERWIDSYLDTEEEGFWIDG